MRTSRLASSVVAVLALFSGSAGLAADPPGKSKAAAAPDPELLPPETRRTAVRKGVAWLDAHLASVPDADGSPRKPFTDAVAGLVHLLDDATRTGPDPVRPIRERLARYVDRVTKDVEDPARLPPAHGLADSRFTIQYVWPVAEAGLFFGELRARGDDGAETLSTLRKIVALLEGAQDANGGWGHGRIRSGPTSDGAATPSGAGGLRYPSTLVASSNCAAATLGLLRGLLGAKEVRPLDRARAYFADARLPNGSYPYDPSQRQSGFAETNVGRTAGTLFALQALGVPRSVEFETSARYVLDRLDLVAEGHGSPCLNVAHAATALRMAGDDAWLRFRRAYERRIVAAQQEDGSFRCVCRERAFGVTCDAGSALPGLFERSQIAYQTALHTFVLLLDGGRMKLLGKPDAADATTPSLRR